MSVLTILAIETSCDETSVSILQAAFGQGSWTFGLPQKIKRLAHVVESQTSHIEFGGVVPEVAARDHLLRVTPLAHAALNQAGIAISKLDAVAVTLGPGLIGALMVGTLFAQGLALALGKPLVGVNHVDAHLAPALLLQELSLPSQQGNWLPVHLPAFPALALTVSGGHCHLSLLKSVHERQVLGHTSDDACGEAFDKVGKMLGLPYPGGPQIEKLAAKSQAEQARFKFRSVLADRENRYGFSFSGLKTQVLDTVRRELGHPTGKINGSSLDEVTKADIAAAFQKAAIGQLLDRIKNALTDFKDIRSVLVAGGVAANQSFRERICEQSNLEIRFAPLCLCSDNATMIALHALLPSAQLLSPHPFSRYTYTQ